MIRYDVLRQIPVAYVCVQCNNKVVKALVVAQDVGSLRHCCCFDLSLGNSRNI